MMGVWGYGWCGGRVLTGLWVPAGGTLQACSMQGWAAHPGSPGLLHSVQKLLQVVPLETFAVVRAGQVRHEVPGSLVQLPASFPQLLAQHIVQVLLNVGPVAAIVHR